MKHLSRKYKKRTLRKNRVFRKKNKKTIVKKRNYKKRNTRKRRRVGGMDPDPDPDDIEVGRINDQSLTIKPKPRVPFIDPVDLMERGTLESPKTTTPILKGPTPSIDPFMSSWQGAPRTSKKNIENYLKKGDFSEPLLTDSQENIAFLKAFEPDLFKESDDEYQTPRSSISSGTYGTPPTGREKIIPDLNTNTPRSEEEDPILNIYTYKSPEERQRVATFLKSTDMPYDEDDDPYSKKNVEKRRKEKEENLRALRNQYGIDTDSD
jgi:hypothetical protein